MLKLEANKQRHETIEQSQKNGLIEAAKFSGARTLLYQKPTLATA
jgi:hypothetical protein